MSRVEIGVREMLFALKDGISIRQVAAYARRLCVDF